MNEIEGVMINNERCKIRGKTPMIGETSTGRCRSNLVKSTMKIVMIHFSLSLLSNSHVPLSYVFARVFIHGDIRVSRFC